MENITDPNYGMFKIGKCEHTMYARGDIFCSLTPEELKQEEQEAREIAEKFHELMLYEKASNMSLMDFFAEWMEYTRDPSQGEDEWKARLRENRRKEQESWSEYRYRTSTYDKERATEKKLARWRKFHMIFDHIWIGALFMIAYLAWNDPGWKFFSYVAIILGILNIIMVAYRWTTFKSTNEWEVN